MKKVFVFYDKDKIIKKIFINRLSLFRILFKGFRYSIDIVFKNC